MIQKWRILPEALSPMELNIDFFHIVNENIAEKGRILISEPFLSDNYFRRSIVYLTEHNEEGSLGFVLNKPLEMKVGEIVNDFPEADFSVSVGGPVSTNTVHFIHTLGKRVPDSVPVTDGIFWGGDFDALPDPAGHVGFLPDPGVEFLAGIELADHRRADHASVVVEHGERVANPAPDPALLESGQMRRPRGHPPFERLRIRSIPCGNQEGHACVFSVQVLRDNTVFS